MKQLGPDPHDRRVDELVRAYARGAGGVLPPLLANPWLPRGALDRIVARRRRRIVEHAAANVPHYRDLYREAGVSPSGFSDPNAFADLPFLEKHHVRDDGARLLWPRADRSRLMERSSSGSTGSPVRAYFDPVAELPRRLQELRLLWSHGFMPWHRQMILDAPQHQAPQPFLPQRLGLWRRDPYPWWLSPERALEEIERLRPDGFHGVLSGIRMLSLAVERAGGLSFRPLRVFTKGELLDPSTRWFIENALGAKVVDFYATEETGIIAWECPKGGGYHLDDDFVFVEVVRPDGSAAAPGEVGELVLTNLYQRAMPIIRYRVGDLGAISPEPCACGRSLRVLRQLKGRRLDFLLSMDGTLRDPFRVMAVIEHVPNVRWFRVLQTERDRVLVRLGWDDSTSGDDRTESERRIREGLHALLGESMRLELEDAGEFRVEIGEKAPLVKGLGAQALAELAEKGYAPSF